MSNRRIRKKRQLCFAANELRDFLTGKERIYPAHRLMRLASWGMPKCAKMSFYRAARIVRLQDRREHVAMQKLIIDLAGGLDSTGHRNPDV